jgi:hypothetical protein
MPTLILRQLRKRNNLLHSQAVWVIMDPWNVQPRHDYEKYPDINLSNKIYADQIIEYLPYVANWIVSCESTIGITPEFEYLPRVAHGDDLRLYVEASGLKRVVYVGFHWGRCILGRADGAKRMSETYKCYAKQNLCGTHPEDDQELMTEYSKPYLTCF